MARTEVEIPEDWFDFEGERPAEWPDHPEVRRTVEWLRDRMTPGEWQRRRHAAAQRLYELVLNGAQPGTAGRYFDTRDAVAWHLFLAEAYVDHIWNYDPVFGSRVVPVFAALGRNLDLLLGVEGIEARVDRMLGPERAQPNGPFFELLVAGACRRAGGAVRLVPEVRGGSRTHDMDVEIAGQSYAVECKRMEVSEYGDAERTRVRELWGPSAAYLGKVRRSTLAQVDFTVPTREVPNEYLTTHVKSWLAAPRRPHQWSDAYGRGGIAALDLGPLRAELAHSKILTGSTRMIELLTGRYVRHQSMVSSIRITPAENPRYADDCDYATLLEWNSLSDAAISGRARDVLRKVADGCGQLPLDRPGIVHVAFEAVEGDHVERVRHSRIVESMRDFDPGPTPLAYVYTHFLAPESPPDQSWAYDETTDVRSIRAVGPPPLLKPFLVIPDDSEERRGAHWQ